MRKPDPQQPAKSKSDRRRRRRQPGSGRVVRLPEVVEIIGLSRTTIWRRGRDESFPAPIRLGGKHARSVDWPEQQICDWIDGLSHSASPSTDHASQHVPGSLEERTIPAGFISYQTSPAPPCSLPCRGAAGVASQRS